MKSLIQILLLAGSLCLPFTASGASALQVSRSAASSARQHVNGVRARQMALRQELNKVASRIEELKGEQKGRLTPGGELDGALKRSQELSGALTGLAQSLSAAEADAVRENLSLLTTLSSELSRLRNEFDRVSDHGARKQLIVQMRSLRAEREQVRAALPASSVPALEAPRSSDNPEDLLEQADAARDNEDKVRRELQKLEGRIAEAREERAFDRRLNEFLGDESIFDDQDRRLRLQRTTTETIARPAAKDYAAPEPTADNPGGQPPGSFAGMTAGSPAPQSGGGLNERAATDSVSSGDVGARTGESSVVSHSSRAADARPSVGGGRGPAVAGSEDDDLEDLEVQRAKLKGLAEELKLRASQLQHKADTLR
ncbi:MAG: TetR family transcriptional regulator [Myxococcaceae bacterium]